MRIRWLAATATVIGLLAGMAFPRPALGDLTGYQLAAAMTPPTLASGSSPLLTCGWHSVCAAPYPYGYALDWDDNNQDYGNPWYFRGFFYTSAPTNRWIATGYPLVTRSDPLYCDIMTVWVVEAHSGQLRGIPTYDHVNITNSASFQITGGPWTVYNTRQIGTTINDSGRYCTFYGSHVHESHVPYATHIVTITRNTSKYPTAQSCHGWCGTFRNNDIYNWTRRFAWAEGA